LCLWMIKYVTSETAVSRIVVLAVWNNQLTNWKHSAMLQVGRSLVRVLMRSLIFFSIYLILPAAQWSRGLPSLY
jgi:hypothetical protein